MAAFHFDPATHTYTLDGRRLPSVSEIIAPLSTEWLAKIPRDVLEQKRAFGTAVHLACELDDLGELDDDATDQDVMVRVSAWRRFKEDTGAEVLLNERRLYHAGLGFAGTLDRLARLPRLSGGPWLIDLKSGDSHASYGVQLAAYALLLAENAHDLGVDVSGLNRAVVTLDAGGQYRLTPHKSPHDEAAFRACLAIHAWKESAK